MIEILPGRWVHEDEFLGRIHGRQDPPEVERACLEYLQRQHAAGRVVAASRQRLPDAVVRSALAAARVQASTVAASGATSRRLAELAATVVQQQTTIDRLLAHIPGRMREVPAARLEAIRGQVAGWARDVFHLNSLPKVAVQPERDAASEACHRLTLTVPISLDVDPEAYVGGEIELHQRLAASLDPDEFRAVQLVVEPQLAG